MLLAAVGLVPPRGLSVPRRSAVSEQCCLMSAAEPTGRRTVAELRQVLRDCGLPVSGRKAELESRLLAATRGRANYELPTTPMLRAALQERRLPTDGKRADLLVRLRLAQACERRGAVVGGARTVVELREALRARGLPVSGRKVELLQRLGTHSLQRRRRSPSPNQAQAHAVLASVQEDDDEVVAIEVVGIDCRSVAGGSSGRLAMSMAVCVSAAVEEFNSRQPFDLRDLFYDI